MRNLLLVGGPGSGKTTLVRALMSRVPGINHVYMARFAVRIPMALIATSHPDLLELPREKYIEKIFANQDVEDIGPPREETDEFGRTIAGEYGDTIIAQIALRTLQPGVPNIIDNTPGISNVRYLKDQGLYVVGLHCDFETQVQRRQRERKGIDPEDLAALREQIRRTSDYFDVVNTVDMADLAYDTDKVRSDDLRIVKEVIRAVEW